MDRARPGHLFLLATVSLANAAPFPLLAQEGTGIRGSFSISQGLEFSDNKSLAVDPAGSTFTTVTRLGFGVLSETRTERLSFSLNGTVEDSSGDGASDTDDLRLTGRDAAFQYTREGSNSALSFNARSSLREVEDDFVGFFVDGEFDPQALLVEGGEVVRNSLGARFQTGIEGPFGLDVSLRRSDREYKDTSDPDLVDQTITSVDVLSSFRIRPNTAVRALAGVREGEREGLELEETSTTYIGVGVETETAGGLTITGDLTVDSSETTVDGVETNDDDGIGIDVAVLQDRVNGSIGFSLSSRIDSAGRRTTASVSRAIEMPTGGLSFSLGIVDQEDGDTGFTSRINYARETPVGLISADIIQQPSTQVGEALLNTSINLGLTHELSPVSELGASLRYGRSSSLSEGDDDRAARTTLGLTYQRDLTEDWGLTAGVEYTRIDDVADQDRDSSTVFVNIGRDFDFGF